MSKISRRAWLQRSSLFAALSATGFFTSANTVGKLKIGACDWSLGKSSDPESFKLAKAIGLAGVQINLGTEGNDLWLRKPDVQKIFKDASRETSVAISSLAIAELNNIPYKSDPRTEQWVSDAVDVASSFGVKVILLAFFNKNDLRNDPQGKAEVIRRLQSVAPKAEKAGVTLGVESYLSAEEHMDIIQKVGSKAIKVFYDFRNSADAGYDVVKEIKWLGRDAICELHIKENGVLLGNGTMDWHRIAETLTAMNFIGDGWMQIEWAMPDKGDVVDSYRQNLKFLKDTFGYL